MNADACDFDALGKRSLAGEGHAIRPLIRRPEVRDGAWGLTPDRNDCGIVPACSSRARPELRPDITRDGPSGQITLSIALLQSNASLKQ
jgi:hypothetical protein